MHPTETCAKWQPFTSFLTVPHVSRGLAVGSNPPAIPYNLYKAEISVSLDFLCLQDLLADSMEADASLMAALFT